MFSLLATVNISWEPLAIRNSRENVQGLICQHQHYREPMIDDALFLKEADFLHVMLLGEESLDLDQQLLLHHIRH